MGLGNWVLPSEQLIDRSAKRAAIRASVMYTIFGVDQFIDYALYATLVLFVLDGGGFEAAFLAIAFAAPGVFFSHVIGKHLDNKGARVAIPAAGTLSLLAVIAVSLSSNLLTILAAVAVRSCCRIAFSTAVPVMISELFEKEHYGAAHSKIQTVKNIGKLLGPVIAGSILIAHSPTFLVYTSIFFSSVLLISSFWVVGSLKEQRTKSDTDDKGASQSKPRLIFNAIRKDRVLLVGLIAFTFSTAALYLSDDFIALLLKYLGFEDSMVAFSIGLIGLGGLFGSISSEILVRKMRDVDLFLLAVLIDVLCFSAYGFAAPSISSAGLNRGLLLLTVFVMGIGVGLGQVAFGLMIQQRAPRNMLARFSAFATAVASAFALLGPVIGGFLADSYSVPLPFQATAVLMLFGLMLSIALVRHSDASIVKYEGVTND